MGGERVAQIKREPRGPRFRSVAPAMYLSVGMVPAAFLQRIPLIDEAVNKGGC